MLFSSSPQKRARPTLIVPPSGHQSKNSLRSHAGSPFEACTLRSREYSKISGTIVYVLRSRRRSKALALGAHSLLTFVYGFVVTFAVCMTLQSLVPTEIRDGSLAARP
jgi:hypothetical protein